MLQTLLVRLGDLAVRPQVFDSVLECLGEAIDERHVLGPDLARALQLGECRLDGRLARRILGSLHLVTGRDVEHLDERRQGQPLPDEGHEDDAECQEDEQVSLREARGQC